MEKKLIKTYLHNLSAAHTYCSTWFPAVAVHPPILALQLSENTSRPGHSSAGSGRNISCKKKSLNDSTLFTLAYLENSPQEHPFHTGKTYRGHSGQLDYPKKHRH